MKTTEILPCIHGRPSSNSCPHCLGVGAASQPMQTSAEKDESMQDAVPCPRCKGNGRIEMLEHCPECKDSGITGIASGQNPIVAKTATTQSLCSDVRCATAGECYCEPEEWEDRFNETFFVEVDYSDDGVLRKVKDPHCDGLMRDFINDLLEYEKGRHS